MMNRVLMQTWSDADLVAGTLAGNREAFGQIVARYQSLVSSLAYNATGSLGRSEDLAQETFLTAWRELRTLREPEKLKSWLCGIARRLGANLARRERREPAHGAEPLDALQASPAPDSSPPDEAMSREEEAILWRSLERIPELYREPLILFYREQQSVERVAASLDLSEEAVRQRLSRGRKLLHEQVAGFVEGALRRSAPGRSFTLGVLAALPVLTGTASAATLGAAATHGTAAAKAAAATGMLGTVLGPIVGLLGAWMGVKASLDNAESARERRLIIRFVWILAGVIAVWLALVGGLMVVGRDWWRQNPQAGTLLFIGGSFAYLVVLLGLIFGFNRMQRRVRSEAALARAQRGEPPAQPRWKTYEYRSRIHLLGLPLVHVRMGRRPDEPLRPVCGWIAIGDMAIGILFASGGVAVGGIAVGGVCVGLLPIAGFAVGLLAVGGLAVGWWAAGGAAIGYLAVGGCAAAWHAAVGGMAVARDIAVGGGAFAAHANDGTARAALEAMPFFSRALKWLPHSGWLMLLGLAPLGLVAWQAWLKRRTR